MEPRRRACFASRCCCWVGACSSGMSVCQRAHAQLMIGGEWLIAVTVARRPDRAPASTLASASQLYQLPQLPTLVGRRRAPILCAHIHIRYIY